MKNILIFTIFFILFILTGCSSKTTYNVSYNPNNPTKGFIPKDPIHYAKGQIVTVLGNNGKLSKTGYSFTGWTNAEGINYIEKSTFVMSTKNVILYAVWTPNNIAYNRNDIDLIFNTEKNLFDQYFSTVWTSFGFMLLIIGWLITSKEARTYFSEHTVPVIFSIIGILLILVVFYGVLLNISKESKVLYNTLNNNIPNEFLYKNIFYSYYNPMKGINTLYSAIPNIVLAVIIILFILNIRFYKRKKKNN